MVTFSWNQDDLVAEGNTKEAALSIRNLADFHLLNLEALEHLDKLDCEIYEEIQIKELLRSTTKELAATIDDLEKRLDEIDNEGSEWKTRYNNQSELNQMLERQVVMLANQVEDTKLVLKDGRISKAFADMTDSALEKGIRMAQKEKMRLEAEIKEVELRMEQEAKAFHRGNEERRQLLSELNVSKQTVMQKHQKSQLDMLQGDLKKLNQLSSRSQAPHFNTRGAEGGGVRGRDNGPMSVAVIAPNVNAHSHSFRESNRNGKQRNVVTRAASIAPGAAPNQRHPHMAHSIGEANNLPPNQRILDPKRGPIRKTAAVKKLPALAHSSASSF